MRPFGARGVNDHIPIPPDTVGSVIISSAGAIIAQDWPSTQANYVLFSGTVDFYANFNTTAAAIPTTNSTGTTASSGLNELNPGLRQVMGGSTGYSITGPSSGIVTASFWHK
jgi:hypothetical protein